MLNSLHIFSVIDVQLWHFPFIFLAGLIGESYGSLIGGGSLVTQPALLFLGVPLQSTLAIDAAAPLATEAGIISETYKNVVKNKKLVLMMVVPITLGGVIGTWLLLNISPEVIKYVMVVSISLILAHTFLSNKRPKSIHVSKTNYVLLFSFQFIIAIYTIFIGLGEGSFGRLALMFTLGLSFVASQGIGAAAKMPARAYSLIVTGYAGLIVWPYLLTFWCSNFIAGKYATKYVKKVPDKYMRTAMVIISLVFAAYLLFYY